MRATDLWSKAHAMREPEGLFSTVRLRASQAPIFITETAQFLRELSALLCSGVEFAIGSSRENATFMSVPGE